MFPLRYRSRGPVLFGSDVGRPEIRRHSSATHRSQLNGKRSVVPLTVEDKSVPLVPGEARWGRAGGSSHEHYRAYYVAKGYGKTANSNPNVSHLTDTASMLSCSVDCKHDDPDVSHLTDPASMLSCQCTKAAYRCHGHVRAVPALRTVATSMSWSRARSAILMHFSGIPLGW